MAAAVAIGAAVWAFLPRAAEPVRPVGSASKRGREPFFQGGSGASVVVSPDGLRLAMVLGAGDDRSLYLREMNQLTQTLLPGTEVAYNPFFSPDGQWIGFVTPTELKKVSISGGTPLTLAKVSRSRGASWGDNDLIVFTESPSSGLFKMPATGGEPQPLTTIDAEKAEFSHRWPQVLPGGRVGAVHGARATDQATGALELVDIETGTRRVVHHGGIYGRYLPSGHLAYVNEGTLFAAPFDLDSGEFTRTPAPVVQGILSAGGAHYSASDDGTLVYLEGQAGTPTYELVLADRRGSATPFTDERRTFVEPRFSPDGRRLAVEILTGSSSDSWVYDIERGTATRLTFGEGPDSGPAVVARRRLDRVGVGAGGRRQSVSAIVGRLGRGGTAHHRRRGQVRELVVAGRPLHPLHPGEQPDRQRHHGASARRRSRAAGLSPDRDLRGRGRVLARRPLGRVPVRRVRRATRSTCDRSRCAAASGRSRSTAGLIRAGARAARSSTSASENSVMMVAVDITGDALRAGTPEQVFEGPFLQANIGGNTYADYDVAPDGQRFAMLRGEGGQIVADHMIVVFHWFDELRSTFSR